MFRVTLKFAEYVVHISRLSVRRCLQLGRREVKVEDDGGDGGSVARYSAEGANPRLLQLRLLVRNPSSVIRPGHKSLMIPALLQTSAIPV